MKVHAIGSVAAREPPWLYAVKRPIVDVDIEYLIVGIAQPKSLMAQRAELNRNYKQLTETKADDAEDDKDHDGGRDGADQMRST